MPHPSSASQRLLIGEDSLSLWDNMWDNTLVLGKVLSLVLIYQNADCLEVRQDV